MSLPCGTVMLTAACMSSLLAATRVVPGARACATPVSESTCRMVVSSAPQ